MVCDLLLRRDRKQIIDDIGNECDIQCVSSVLPMMHIFFFNYQDSFLIVNTRLSKCCEILCFGQG